ncbi:SERTA domain-containing protein 3 [Stygiomarasmius scandens]|uniref:SERTA domain-containing protein 3 n=1 Tax=Marasmiellus scandens TaxID=2682957 RepID=A0ABR1J4I9_9AGAR
MSVSQMKRTAPEDSTKPEHPLPKVRLITQPHFGHELRQAQQTIAALKGEVAVSTWAEKVAKGKVSSLQSDLEDLRKYRDELEVEIEELQETESTELQRLGAENVTLTRQLSQKNIEIQALQNLLKELGLLSVVSTQVADNVPSESARGASAEKNEAANESAETDEDLFEREASVLRNLKANVNATYRVLYPLDALPNREAQNWFHQAFNYVDVDLGPEYADFIVKWIEFERFHLWKKTNGRLATSKRPKDITDWINGGRYPPRYKGPRIELDFASRFSKDMQEWWISLQLPTPLNPEECNDDWASLNKSGLNGWFSVVVGLKWWGHGLRSLQGENLGRSTREWVAMVGDATVALEKLLKFLKRTE